MTTQAAPPTSVLMGLIFKARLHVDHVAAAVARNDENVDRYRMILADREAHMTALLEENARAGGDASVIPPAADIAQVDIPDEAAELLALIRDDAGQAQTNFTDAALSATPYQAQLLAAIAACVASHRAVLA